MTQFDLTAYAGFPLGFDPERLRLTSLDGFAFIQKERTAQHIIDVLRNPSGIDPERVMYYLYYLAAVPERFQVPLDRYSLTYSLVMVPPGTANDEYHKTSGHYHPFIPGTEISFPEVYTQLFGTLQLLLQKLDPEDSERVLDCCLVEMTPGYVITVPPGYAHVLINTGASPGLMAGLYGKNFTPDYQHVRKKRGLAYYLVLGETGLAIERNSRYTQVPPLYVLEHQAGTPFAADEPDKPLWISFIQDPERYAFLTQAEATLRRFPQMR